MTNGIKFRSALLTRKRELLLFAQLIARSADKLKAQAVELSGYLLIRLITVLTRLLPGLFLRVQTATHHSLPLRSVAQ